MRAVVLDRFGGPEVLQVREVPPPTPGAGEVLVRVRASALNRADLIQREGRYRAPADAPQSIPGIEYAGEIADVGTGVTAWRPGQRVFGIAGGGAHAEQIVVPQGTLAEIPAALDWPSAGAVPEAFITAHDALFTQAGLARGERVLVHAVASGVGLAAVQLIRAAGATAYGTSRTPDKIEQARPLGLTDGVVIRDDLAALAEAVERWTEGRGIDVVLDLVGGAYTPASINVLAVKGRLMLVGLMAGGAPQPIDLRRILSQRIMLRGTLLRPRSREEKSAATSAFVRDVVPDLARGEIRPVIDSVFPLDAIADAHRRMESNETVGKVVIAID
jgi:putative PIG3 family NAD(P)H quinone oxidoreductase